MYIQVCRKVLFNEKVKTGWKEIGLIFLDFVTISRSCWIVTNQNQIDLKCCEIKLS